MTITELYEEFGADGNDVLDRIGSEERLKKYLTSFLKDGSMREIDIAIGERDATVAFRGVHTMKGICLNLGISSLARISSELCELLRGRTSYNALDNYSSELKELKVEYERVKALISEFVG